MVLYHEPWRDEIHAWTMAKYLSLKDLFIVSKFDGHPILWHLFLMPFAKLNFPIITIQLISYIAVSISAYLFFFKTKISTIPKIIILFTTPFLYIYSAIARNYCLILLLLTIIGINYQKRYDKPILYSILICLLIHTHALAWGLVAGLTITFHIWEIIKYLKNKDNSIKIKQILIGTVLIIINTLIVVFELYGTNNPDYILVVYDSTKKLLKIILGSLIFFILLTLKFAPKNKKELLIPLCGLSFQCIIYLFVYGAILEPRFFLPCVIWLFFIILIQTTDISKKNLLIISIAYIIFTLLTGYIHSCYHYIIKDINRNYSSTQEMANFINNNLGEEDKILVTSSIICQTLVPYLKNAHLYDIYYKEYFENIKFMSNIKQDDYDVFSDIDTYSDNYLLVTSNITLDYDLIYTTKSSISGEKYKLYYIK